MNEINLKEFVKKRSLQLTFFVLFSLVISENVLAQKFRIEDYVKIERNNRKDGVAISAIVYDNSLGPNKHQFLLCCTFEACSDGGEYFKLMELNTEHQTMSNQTKMIFRNKLNGARIHFKENIILQGGKKIWPEYLSNKMEVTIPKSENEKGAVTVVDFTWLLEKAQKDIRYLRISGIWKTEESKSLDPFLHVVYDLNKANPSALKLNTPCIKPKVSKNDSAKVFKDAEAIVIKRVDFGANIRVYTTSGTEIKSVISNNVIVKIDLPAKQLYIVQIGNSQHKVAL